MEDASKNAESANWLQDLLILMGYNTSVDIRVAEASPEQVANNSNNYWLELKSDSLQSQQVQRLVGQDGIVIDSLQYLANLFLNRQPFVDTNSQESHNFYTVELEGYRSQRLNDLNLLAEQAVQQVRETQAEFAIKQLSSADRRYIHQLLEEFTDIETHSQGREPNRHLIVKLAKI